MPSHARVRSGGGGVRRAPARDAMRSSLAVHHARAPRPPETTAGTCGDARRGHVHVAGDVRCCAALAAGAAVSRASSDVLSGTVGGRWRWCVRPATMPRPSRRWGSASTTTCRCRGRRARPGLRARRDRRLSTCTTATARSTIFDDDPRVLFISLASISAATRAPARRPRPGDGAGAGFTVNIPHRAGATDARLRAVFDRVVVPVLDEFAPRPDPGLRRLRRARARSAGADADDATQGYA